MAARGGKTKPPRVPGDAPGTRGGGLLKMGSILTIPQTGGRRNKKFSAGPFFVKKPVHFWTQSREFCENWPVDKENMPLYNCAINKPNSVWLIHREKGNAEDEYLRNAAAVSRGQWKPGAGSSANNTSKPRPERPPGPVGKPWGSRYGLWACWSPRKGTARQGGKLGGTADLQHSS